MRNAHCILCIIFKSNQFIPIWLFRFFISLNQFYIDRMKIIMKKEYHRFLFINTKRRLLTNIILLSRYLTFCFSSIFLVHTDELLSAQHCTFSHEGEKAWFLQFGRNGSYLAGYVKCGIRKINSLLKRTTNVLLCYHNYYYYHGQYYYKYQLSSSSPLLLLLSLYYYMRNFCNLIGLEQWCFSLILNTYMSKLQTFL